MMKAVGKLEQRFAVRAFLINKSFEKRNNVLVMRKCGGLDSGFWDVPGGVVSIGENPYTSLRKWIKEQTGLADVGISTLFEIGERNFSTGGVNYQVIDNYFRAFTIFDVERLSENHDAYEWINPTRYYEFDFIGGKHGSLSNAFESYLENRARVRNL